MNRLSGIYKIENLVNGNIYIGQSSQIEERLRQHFRLLRRNKHYNTHLQRSWNKYGEENFVIKTVLFCENFESTYYEQSLVNKLSPSYNTRLECVNSNFGMKHSEETKKRISEARKGIIFSAEHLRNMSISRKGKPSPLLGRHQSEESKRKNSEAHQGEKNNRFGKHHSEETKRKMAEAQRGPKSHWFGTHQSEETKRKKSQTLKLTWKKRKEIKNGNQ